MIRGDVVRLPSPAGARYGVVVQADDFALLSTAVVVPTSRSARPASFRPEIAVLGESTRVLVEQVRAVDVDHLRVTVGHLLAEEMSGIDVALSLILGLRPAGGTS